MKKMIQIAFALLIISNVGVNAQTALKKGSVNYKMTTSGNDEAAAMMGESTISVHFDEKTQATDMTMMNGMMVTKTIIPVGNIKDARMTFDAMGMKYEIIELPEEAFKANSSLTDLKNATEIVYDKKDTKEIAGFKCYKATVKLSDGTSSVLYITEAIAPQVTNAEGNVKLVGYPLEIKVSNPQGEMTITATSFSKELPKDCFTIGEGYKKVTMEEFQKQMGGM